MASTRRPRNGREIKKKRREKNNEKRQPCGDIVNFLIAHYVCVRKEFKRGRERKSPTRMVKTKAVTKLLHIILSFFFFFLLLPRLQNVTKFKCDVGAPCCVAVAICKDASSHCLQLLLSPLFSHLHLWLVRERVECVSLGVVAMFFIAFFRLCALNAASCSQIDDFRHHFYIFIIILRCCLPPHQSPPLFFSRCSCRLVLLFFSFLQFFFPVRVCVFRGR